MSSAHACCTPRGHTHFARFYSLALLAGLWKLKYGFRGCTISYTYHLLTCEQYISANMYVSLYNEDMSSVDSIWIQGAHCTAENTLRISSRKLPSEITDDVERNDNMKLKFCLKRCTLNFPPHQVSKSTSSSCITK